MTAPEKREREEDTRITLSAGVHAGASTGLPRGESARRDFSEAGGSGRKAQERISILPHATEAVLGTVGAEEDDLLARIRAGAIEHFETLRRAKDGTLVPVPLTISPIRNERGEVVGASKIARDITARIRAEEERRDDGSIKAVS